MSGAAGRRGIIDLVNRFVQSLIPDATHAKAVRTYGGEPDLYAASQSPTRRISSRNASRHSQTYGGSDAIDWVMDCVDLYAQTASNAKYHWERDGKKYVAQKSDSDADDVHEAPADLAALFAHPCPTIDWTELIELAVIDILLAGEFFWLKFQVNTLGKPKALYRISPALIEVVPDAVAPKGYIYTPPGGKPMKLSPDEVLHVKRPNPHNPWRGLSYIAGGPRTFDLELSLTDQMANYYQQGTKLAGTLESDRSVPPSSFQKIKRGFLQMYAGAANAHKVAVLERGLKFKPTSADAQQAEFAVISKWSRDRVHANFKCSPVLTGDVGGVDRQSVREAQRIFDNKVMRPFLNRVQSMISLGLTQAWGFDFVIEHEYVMPIEDKLDLAVGLATLPGLQVKDIREAVGKPPLGDERDEIVLNLPGLPREEGGHPDPNLAGEAGRPPQRENTVAFPKPGQALPPSANAREGYQKALRDNLDRIREMLPEGALD